MAFRLIPRDERFFALFVEDGATLLEAARLLEEMVHRYDNLEERVAAIRVLEHRGDELDVEVNRRLERSFVTPFDREDIHALMARMDDVLDRIQEVAETFVIYGVDAPTDEARRLSSILAGEAAELDAALRQLHRLKGVDAHLQRIHELEHEADGLSRAAVARLFRDRHDPLDVIKWRDVYNELEEAIDAAEDAAEVIERMLHKGS